MRNDESVQTIEETAMSVDDVEAIVSLDLFTNLKKEDEAAEKSGFGSRTTMYRAFTAIYALSPKEYRLSLMSEDG